MLGFGLGTLHLFHISSVIFGIACRPRCFVAAKQIDPLESPYVPAIKFGRRGVFDHFSDILLAVLGHETDPNPSQFSGLVDP